MLKLEREWSVHYIEGTNVSTNTTALNTIITTNSPEASKC